MKKKTGDFLELSNRLINHYDCFNRERFYLDELKEKDGLVSVVASSISDHCPLRLCRGIARFIKRNINAERYPFIYITAYFFKTSDL